MVLRDDSKRSLDMDEIVENVKAQYANMASRSREEAENWNKKKVKKYSKLINISFLSVNEMCFMKAANYFFNSFWCRWMSWSSTPDSVSRRFVI